VRGSPAHSYMFLCCLANTLDGTRIPSRFMLPEATLDTICRIPEVFRGGKSPRSAVRASGYASIRDQVTPADVARHLEQNPAYIDAWELYSLDKRTSGGWYFVREESGWRVGSVSISYPDEYFESVAEACSQFVLREVEAIYCGFSFRKPLWPRPWQPRHRDRAI